MMTIAEMLKTMLERSGSAFDRSHLVHVWAYARTIGELEGLDAGTQYILEAAAILHDIACPLCRKKYGCTDYTYQQEEGIPLAAEFLKDAGLPAEDAERIVYLVGHHHMPEKIDGPDFQILIEADYLVNAEECGYPAEMVNRFCARHFKTGAGIGMLRAVYSHKE